MVVALGCLAGSVVQTKLAPCQQNAGDKTQGGGASELLGTALQGTILRVVCGYSELGVWRIFWGNRQEPGWPIETATTTEAAARVRPPAGAALQLVASKRRGVRGS